MIDYFCRLSFYKPGWGMGTVGPGLGGVRCIDTGRIECITAAGSDLESGLLMLSLNKYYYCY
jgi:hypothetical protein